MLPSSLLLALVVITGLRVPSFASALAEVSARSDEGEGRIVLAQITLPTLPVPTLPLPLPTTTLPLPVPTTVPVTTTLPAPTTTVTAPVPTTLPAPTTTLTLPLPVPTTLPTLPLPVPTTLPTLPLPVPTTLPTLPLPVPTVTLPLPVPTTLPTLPLPLPVPTTTLRLPLPVPTTTLTLPPVPTTTLRLPLPVPTTTLRLPLPVPTTTLRLPLPVPTTTLRLPLPVPTTTLRRPLPIPTTTTTTPGRLVTTTTIVTTPDASTSSPSGATCGTGCDDENSCTDDVCLASGLCQHVPMTGPVCDDGDPCTTGGDHCSAGLCVSQGIGCARPAGRSCSDTCADDGFSCTEDVCTAEGCLHVPVDSRCAQLGACTAAICAPELGRADPEGCVPGVVLRNGQRCGEDTDACTDDVCRGGECVHERISDASACAPLQGVLREAVALEAVTRGLLHEVAEAAAEVAAPLAARLRDIQGDLSDAARALAGEQIGGIAPATTTRARPKGSSETTGIPARQQARIAFTQVLRTPRKVAAFLNELTAALQRDELENSLGKRLVRGGRRLLKGTKLLKDELRELQKDGAKARAKKRGGKRAAKRH